MNKELLIVDDDVPFRIRLSKSMEKKVFIVESFSSSTESKKRIAEKNFDFAIVDMRLEDGSGLELIKFINSIHSDTKSLLLTGYGNIATAVAAIKSGAIDYLPKPS
ncbi:MAG: response regulator, partial [Pseudomonadota bacterium]|nr:response regulator [Pseudomonadota bacterium]